MIRWSFGQQPEPCGLGHRGWVLERPEPLVPGEGDPLGSFDDMRLLAEVFGGRDDEGHLELVDHVERYPVDRQPRDLTELFGRQYGDVPDFDERNQHVGVSVKALVRLVEHSKEDIGGEPLDVGAQAGVRGRNRVLDHLFPSAASGCG